MTQCQECRFWVERGGPVRHGQCRRYAPLAVVEPGYETLLSGVTLSRTNWPVTLPTDGCGDGVNKQNEPRF